MPKSNSEYSGMTAAHQLTNTEGARREQGQCALHLGWLDTVVLLGQTFDNLIGHALQRQGRMLEVLPPRVLCLLMIRFISGPTQSMEHSIQARAEPKHTPVTMTTVGLAFDWSSMSVEKQEADYTVQVDAALPAAVALAQVRMLLYCRPACWL